MTEDQCVLNLSGKYKHLLGSLYFSVGLKYFIKKIRCLNKTQTVWLKNPHEPQSKGLWSARLVEGALLNPFTFNLLHSKKGAYYLHFTNEEIGSEGEVTCLVSHSFRWKIWASNSGYVTPKAVVSPPHLTTYTSYISLMKYNQLKQTNTKQNENQLRVWHEPSLCYILTLTFENYYLLELHLPSGQNADGTIVASLTG